VQDRDNLVNDAGEAVTKAEAAEKAAATPPGDFVSDLLQSSYYHHQPGTGEMRHGTEGWQALETSFVVGLDATPCLPELPPTHIPIQLLNCIPPPKKVAISLAVGSRASAPQVVSCVSLN